MTAYAPPPSLTPFEAFRVGVEDAVEPARVEREAVAERRLAESRALVRVGLDRAAVLMAGRWVA